jgi:hypothetical protein
MFTDAGEELVFIDSMVSIFRTFYFLKPLNNRY